SIPPSTASRTAGSSKPSGIPPMKADAPSSIGSPPPGGSASVRSSTTGGASRRRWNRFSPAAENTDEPPHATAAAPDAPPPPAHPRARHGRGDALSHRNGSAGDRTLGSVHRGRRA